MGLVTNIQRFSIHDGPGIRTTVFLKGCNLACAWCHNPETISPKPELQYLPDKCIGCGACVEPCPTDAHSMVDGVHLFDRSKCIVCGKCTETCYAGALELIGSEMTPQEVVDEVLLDAPFYKNSGGGVTISGGEPLFQVDFTREIFKLSKENGLHTAMESALAWKWNRVASVLDSVDLVLADLKHIDDDEHKRWTGVSNKLTMENLRRVAESGKELIIRTPVIPGVNDTEQVINAIADFAADLPGVRYYELLPFHPLGSGKYVSLGKRDPMNGTKSLDKSILTELAESAKDRGVRIEYSA